MRTLVIGDIHGCLKELVALLQEASYRPGHDRAVFVGDLVDRGPASVETVAFVRRLCEDENVHVVRGNHEDRYVRYWLRLNRKRTASKLYALRLPRERFEILRALRDDDLDWFQTLPDYFVGEGFLVVHAGVCSRRHRSLADLDNPEYRYRLLNLRNVDGQGYMRTRNSVASTDRHWSETYDGRFGLVLYGHDRSGSVRRADHSLGIDTGCCFGGRLTAAVLVGGRLVDLVSVPALDG